jgi:PAS fold
MDQLLSPYHQARNIWATVTKIGQELSKEVDLAVHKKLLDIVSVGPFYFYIFDFQKGALTFVSDSVKEVLGYEPQEFTSPLIFERMHPDDLP